VVQRDVAELLEHGLNPPPPANDPATEAVAPDAPGVPAEQTEPVAEPKQ
jgi:hypothetical protein